MDPRHSPLTCPAQGRHRPHCVADSLPCSPRSAFTTATGIRCPSPLAEYTPQQTPRARRARGILRFRGPTATQLSKDTPMSTLTVTGTTDVDATLVDATERIGQLRGEIDACDDEIIALVQRRLAISQEIGSVRAASGGTRLNLSREQQVLAPFRPRLGRDGATLGMLLLRLGRGRL